MKQRHILGAKLFFTVIFLVISMYFMFGIMGGVLGLCNAIIVFNMLDKNYKNCMFKELIRVIITEVILVFATMVASINYITLIIVTFIISLLVNRQFIYYKKNPRTMGFFYIYLLVVYFKIKVQNIDYFKIFLACIVGSILVMIFYYLLVRKKVFNEEEEEEHLIEFKNFKEFKLRFNILSSIAYTAAVFVTKYFFWCHGLWLAITLFVVLLPDRDLSRKKVIHRIIGTIIGAIVFIVITQIFSKTPDVLEVLSLIAVYYMFYPAKHYMYQAICITFVILNLDSVFYKTQSHLFLGEYRIVFTIIGCIIIILLFELERLIENIIKKRKIKKGLA